MAAKNLGPVRLAALSLQSAEALQKLKPLPNGRGLALHAALTAEVHRADAVIDACTEATRENAAAERELKRAKQILMLSSELAALRLPPGTKGISESEPYDGGSTVETFSHKVEAIYVASGGLNDETARMISTDRTRWNRAATQAKATANQKQIAFDAVPGALSDLNQLFVQARALLKSTGQFVSTRRRARKASQVGTAPTPVAPPKAAPGSLPELVGSPEAAPPAPPPSISRPANATLAAADEAAVG